MNTQIQRGKVKPHRQKQHVSATTEWGDGVVLCGRAPRRHGAGTIPQGMKYSPLLPQPVGQGGARNGRLKANWKAKTRNAQPFVCTSMETLPSHTLKAASSGESKILYWWAGFHLNPVWFCTNFHAFICTNLTSYAFLRWGRPKLAGGARKEKRAKWVWQGKWVSGPVLIQTSICNWFFFQNQLRIWPSDAGRHSWMRGPIFPLDQVLSQPWGSAAFPRQGCRRRLQSCHNKD